MSVQVKEILDAKYLELHEIYKDTDKASILVEAERRMITGDYDGAYAILEDLLDKKALIEKISVHLNGKPVEKTFRRVLAGETKNSYEILKGIFSLGCHVCIELEKGHMEYRWLLSEVMSNIYKVMESI